MRTIKLLSLSLLAVFAFSACSDDDDAPAPVLEQEEITTLNVFLTPEGGTESLVFSFTDLDGDGSNAQISTENLEANTTYTGRMEFLNENEEPVEDVTEEVLEEDDEHQVFLIAGTGLNVNTEYLDADGDGNPIGVEFRLVTGEASSGDLTFILIHDGDKEAGSNGVLTLEVGGDTDIEVTFDVTIVV